MPLTKTTEEDDLLLRFLAATDARIKNYPGRIPMGSMKAHLAVAWLRGLVGKLNEDGSLEQTNV